MSTTVLLLVSLFAALGGKIFSKLCSNAVVGNSNGRYAIFMAVNGTVACAFFFVWGGFRVSANLPTLMYAAVYAVIVVISLISNMLALKYINIATLTVVLSAFGLVTTSAVGALLFNETPDLTKITRIAVMLAAVILFAVDGKVNNKSKGGSKGFSAKAVIVVAILLAVGCAGSVVTKYFSLDSRVTDENSFFFCKHINCNNKT